MDLAEARARQEEELESLRLIYSDEFVSTHADAEESGVTVVQVKLGKSKGEERPPPLCANAVDALIHHVVRAVAKVAPEVGRLRHKELRVYR